MSEVNEELERLGACDRGRVLGRDFATLEEAWQSWHLGPDLLWIAAMVGVPRKLVTLAACDCARLVLPMLAPDNMKLGSALDFVEAFAGGRVPHDTVMQMVRWVRQIIPDKDAITVAEARMAAARRTIECVAETTWAELPRLADVASDSAVQTYRVARFQQSADLVRMRIPWEAVKTARGL